MHGVRAPGLVLTDFQRPVRTRVEDGSAGTFGDSLGIETGDDKDSKRKIADNGRGTGESFADKLREMESGSLIDEFMKWAKMSPAEKIRAMILDNYGLTEEALRNLPPEERQKIEDEITQAIKEKLGLSEGKLDESNAARLTENSGREDPSVISALWAEPVDMGSEQEQ